MPKVKDNLREFLQVKNSTDTHAELYFYGDIVSDWQCAFDDIDQYPEAVRDFLKEHEGKDLDIYINSGGGAVFAGLAIYNMLKRHKGHKRVHVDGIAASIASIIAFAGDEVLVPSNAFLMIHKPTVSLWGNADDFRKTADELDIFQDGLVSTYVERALEGVTKEEIDKMVNAETWLTGEQAKEYFDITVTPEVQMAAKLEKDSISKYKQIPESLLNSLEKPEKTPKNEKNPQSNEDLEKIKQKILRCSVIGTTKGAKL